MRKKLIVLAGIGFLVGVFVGYLIPWMASGGKHVFSPEFLDRFGSVGTAILLQTLISGLYGSVCMGGTVLYQMERWPLALVSALHYLLCAVPYIPIAFLLGWVSNLKELLLVEGVMLVIYFIIWLIMSLRYKSMVRELNKLVERAKEKQ